MDITKLPRSSIYEEKNSLDYFDVDLEGTVDYSMYNELLEKKNLGVESGKTLMDTYLLFFNDAYFIVTSVLLDNRPELNFDFYACVAGRLSDDISLSSFNSPIKERYVLAMVCALLETNFPSRKEIQRFLVRLNSWITKSIFSRRIYDNLMNNTSIPNNTVFLPCALKQDSLKNIDWEEIAVLFNSHGDFLQNECKAVIDKLGKDNIEKLMVINSMLDYFEKQVNETI